MNEKELFALKEQIDQAKIKVSELRGRRDYLMQQLDKQWGCKSLDDARELVKKLDKNAKDLDEQVTLGVKQIEAEIKNERV